jgi:hypothetical protein
VTRNERPWNGRPNPNAHLEAEQFDDTEPDHCDDVLELLERLSRRVLVLEHRLAAAGVPHAPNALDRQRRYSRARLVSSSHVARFVAEREGRR